MTRDDVIRIAREAGFEVGRDAGGEYVAPQYSDSVGTLVRFAALVAAAEREARIKAQTELEDLRKEMQDRGTREIKAAYERGVRDEREACAILDPSQLCISSSSAPHVVWNAYSYAIRARGT